MEFRIDITEPALVDAAEYVQRIRDVNGEPDAAARWFRGLVRALYSLQQNPKRCAVISESKEFPAELRHLIYYSHRIVFRVDDDGRRVVVQRIFHGQRRLRRDDLL